MKSKVKKSILLVEDDTILAMSEEMDLKDYGYSVMTECSGEDAVNFVKLNPDIDLILMDIDLGSGIDGTEAAEIILKDRDIPVIFVSSHTEPEIVERTEKITSYGYVVKGSGITALDASIKMAFKLFEAKISEKRKGESLSRSEERFTLAMNASNDGLFDWNLITGEVYYSPGWKKMLGYEDNELQNKVSTWESLIEPGDLVKSLEIHEKLISKEIDRFKLDIKMRHKKGHWVDILSRAEAVFDEDNNAVRIVGTHVDITERKQAEKVLKASENRLFDFFEGAPLGYQSLDSDGRFIAVNPAWTETLGYRRDEVIGKWFGDFLAPEYVNAFKERFPLFKEQGHIKSEFYMMRKNGEKIFVTFDGRIGQNADGSFKQTHCILKDETTRKLAENEIFKQLTDKETLLKEVNHRVKNNIASIESLLSLQLNAISNPEAVSALNDALTRVKGMRILYDKLLLSKDYKDVSIKEYAESLIDAIYNVFSYDESVIVKKDIEDFELSIKLVLPIGIILNELLTNVFKYAFNGRDGGQVSIILDKSVNRISLKISDNGNGLDDDFELDKSTGFGLTIVKMLAEQLNGTFSIENDNGTKSVLNIDISNSE